VSGPSREGPAPWGWVAGCAAALVLVVLTLAGPATAGAAASAPLPGASESATGAWAVVPMGQLSDPTNTFWQLLRGHPGSSAWSVVTPQGVADNGGLVATASGAEVVVGFLPSQLLRYSPLSVSQNGGTTWSPAFLPGALSPRPDALAAGPGAAGALAIVGTRVLHAPPTLASWSRLVSLAGLRSAAAGCGAGALDAVAFAPSGTPIVATSCTRGGRIGLFTQATGRWEPASLALSGRLHTATTSVLTLSSGTGLTTALVLARSASGNDLLALWQSASRAWTASAPLPLPSGTAVTSAANGVGGAMTVLAGSTAYQVFPGRPWVRLPPPPPGTVAVASTIPATTVYAAVDADAFVVHGTELRVFALTPAGTTWALVQTTQVPLAYGSSGPR
jgi:hypothetical protein